MSRIGIRSGADKNASIVGTWDRRTRLQVICKQSTRQPDGVRITWWGVSDLSGYRGWVSPNLAQLTEYLPEPLPGETTNIPRRPQLFAAMRDPRFGVNQAWEEAGAAEQARDCK